MDLAHAIVAPTPHVPMWIPIELFVLIVVCIAGTAYFQNAHLDADVRRRRLLVSDVTLFVVLLVSMVIAAVTSLTSSNAHNQMLTRAVVTYVHDHNQLVALQPVDLDANGRGATFDASDPAGTLRHVHVTWTTGHVAGTGETLPVTFNPISVTIQP